MKTFEWADASSVEEAIQLTVKGSAFKAGGLDVVDLMKEHLAAPTRLVNIRRIPGLDQISEDEKSIKIGPLVTLTQLSEHPVINQYATALAQSAGHAATPQVRNMATLGGNILQRPPAGTSATSSSPAARRAARSASPRKAKTSTTPSSTTGCAPSSTRPPPRRR